MHGRQLHSFIRRWCILLLAAVSFGRGEALAGSTSLTSQYTDTNGVLRSSTATWSWTQTQEPDGDWTIVMSQSWSGDTPGRVGWTFRSPTNPPTSSTQYTLSGGTYSNISNDWNLHFWIHIGNTSNGSQRTVALYVPPEYYVTVTVPANPSAVPVAWSLIQDGQVVQTFVQAPGASALIQQVPLPTNAPVSLRGVVRDLVNDGISWVQEGGAVTEVQTFGPSTPTPTPGGSGVGGSTATPSVELPKDGGGDGGGGSVWKNPETTTAATDQAIRQASEKEQALLRKIWERQQTQIDSAATADAAALAKLEEQRVLLEKILTEGEEQDSEAMIPGKVTSLLEAAQNIVEEQSNIPTVTVAKQTVGGAGVDWPTVEIGHAGTFSFSPWARFPWLSSAFAWAREIILIILAAAFVLSCQAKLFDALRSAAMVPQVDATGSVFSKVPGIATVKMMTSATAIITAVLVMVSALVVWINSELGATAGVSITSLFGGNLMGTADGWMGRGLAEMDKLLPMAAVLEFLGLRIAFGFFAMTAYAGAAAAVRFLKL